MQRFNKSWFDDETFSEKDKNWDINKLWSAMTRYAWLYVRYSVPAIKCEYSRFMAGFFGYEIV